jgi:hypothetical protein
MEKNELIKKRERNVYDLLALQNASHMYYQEINSIIQTFHQQNKQLAGLGNRQTAEIDILLAEQRQFYSETVKVYSNRVLKDHIMIMYLGLLYFF